jgi:hypothetical protein
MAWSMLRHCGGEGAAGRAEREDELLRGNRQRDRRHAERRARRVAAWTLAPCLLLGACGEEAAGTCATADDCAPDERCLDARCVPRNAPPPDAGSDSGEPRRDAGPTDAGPSDGGASETVCDDGADGDGDGLADCADPDCAGRRCGPTSTTPRDCRFGGDACLEEGRRNVAIETSVCIQGACEPQTGGVSEPCTRETDGDGCDDGRFCTADGSCRDGVCTPSGAGPCTGSEACTEDEGGACVACPGDPVCACSNVCGDADQDGDVDSADVARVWSWVGGDGTSPSGCQLGSADVDRDGSLTARDAEGIDALVDGAATGGCAAPCTGVCGDANQNGVVNVTDASMLIELSERRGLGRPVSLCAWLDGDLVDDGVLDDRDVRGAVATASAGVPPEGACEPCEQVCGDLDGNGSPGAGADVATFVALLGSSDPIDICTFTAADLDADGELTELDGTLLPRLFLGQGEGACEPCGRTCGDANGDGIVDIDDVDAIRNVALTGEADVCTYAVSDTNGDGEVNAGDITALASYFTTPGASLACRE